MKSRSNISYTTGSSPADAAAFYQAQLPALGWQPAGDPVAADTLALQDFTQAGRQLSLIITKDESGITVHLMLGPIER